MGWFLLLFIKLLDFPIRLYNAAPSERFGNINRQKTTESTHFHPRSPYAVAKAAVLWTAVLLKVLMVQLADTC